MRREQVSHQDRNGVLINSLLAAMCLLQCSGCIPGCREEPPEGYAEFFSLPKPERYEKMAELPIEKQFELYVYGMSKRHPPDLGLADPIAARGTEVVPFLLDRLKEARSDSERRNVVHIFEIMALVYEIDLKKDPELMRRLDEEVSAMSEPAKGLAIESLDVIRRDAATDAEPEE